MPTDLTEARPKALTLAAAESILDAVEARLGGRRQLVESLLAAPADDSLDYVIGLIADPRNDCRKLASICAMGDVSLGEFLEAFKRGAMAPALAEAVFIVAQKLPEITQDVVTRATVHEGDCGGCSGRGFIIMRAPDGHQLREDCLICVGTGRETHQPEFEQQKFVLEKLGGLGVQKAPLVAIDNSKHLTFDASREAHAKLLRAADQLLYGRPSPSPIIDTEPLAPTTDGE